MLPLHRRKSGAGGKKVLDLVGERTCPNGGKCGKHWKSKEGPVDKRCLARQKTPKPVDKFVDYVDYF